MHDNGVRGVTGFQFLHHPGRIVDLPVDLAAGREPRHPVRHQFRQALAAGRYQLRHQQPRQHAAVTVGEIPEIVVRAHFTAIDGVFRAHSLFDERMPRFAHYRHATAGFDDILRVPGQPRVVNNRRTRLGQQKHLGQQTDDVITFDVLAQLVEEETAIEIAVPGDAQVGPG